MMPWFSVLCFVIAAAIIGVLIVFDMKRRRLPPDTYDGNWGGHP